MTKYFVAAIPALFFLSHLPAFCQVQVMVTTDKADYLVGEPIFAFVNVKNVGAEPVGYSACESQADLTVEGGRRKEAPNLWGCYAGEGEGGGICGVDHPPLMKPGETVSFPYLLKGYQLPPGNYILHASGKAGVRWKYYPDLSPNPAPTPPPAHREGELVKGSTFDVSIPLTVKAGTEEELKQQYVPYLAEAEGYTEGRVRARQAIAEMAPPFLEKAILQFASDPNTANLAVEGLGQIRTAESRSDLIHLFDTSSDLRLRGFIVKTLAAMGTSKELEFFSSMLGGRSTELDDKIRQYAALGLGRIGGDAAVESLQPWIKKGSKSVRSAVALALGNTRSSRAIPVLLDMYSDPDGEVQNSVSGALKTITHYRWVDESNTLELSLTRWRRWWDTHGKNLVLYGPDQCPPWNAPLPSPEGEPNRVRR